MKVMWFVYAMIGNVLWSITDVWASMVMNRVHKDPFVVGFFLGLMELAVLFLLSIYSIPTTEWLGWLAVSSVFAYLGMLTFFYALNYVDVSVSSASWVFMSIGIAAGGLFLFGEQWTLLNTLGALLSITGVILLLFWNRHISLLRTCVILSIPGLTFVPFFLINDALMTQGLNAYVVFFWNTLIHGILAVVVPLVIPKYRREVVSFSSKISMPFFYHLFPRSILTALASYATIKSYALGDASLVGMAENGQPFFIVAFAWLATALFPKKAPKELLTKQSIGIKLLSFSITFIGLGLLVVG